MTDGDHSEECPDRDERAGGNDRDAGDGGGSGGNDGGRADGDERGTGDGTEPPAAADPSILHLTPAERAERSITDEQVRAAFLAVVRDGDEATKDLRGITLPALDLDRLFLAGEDRHPVDLRDATIEGTLSAAFSTIELPILLDGATVGGLDLDNAHVQSELSGTDVTVTGEVDAFEATFDGDVHFDDAAFEGPVRADEAVFDDDVSFDGATFAADAQFRGAEFHGNSNLLDDNTSFTGATFEATADFRQASLGFTHFEDVAFEDVADFQEVEIDGDVDVDRATFAELADFDEARIDGDASFVDCVFEGPVHARGATFTGGERALEDDVTFAGSTFHDDADFHAALFRYVSFADVEFDAHVDFEEASFTADADFPGATFGGEVDFDEARFAEDADFSGVHFADYCAFRGVEFQGGANFLEEDVSFDGARFDAAADFHNADVSSASFLDTAFGDEVDFSGATFRERIDFEASQIEGDAFVDFTRASIRSGTIAQPADDWIRYDLTLASVGDVELVAESESDYRRLLDFFRFCRTEFDEFDGHEFDFAAHRGYLDRNAWALHEFHEPPDAAPDYELAMMPEVIETTYLKAKQAASSVGDMKVAGEFRVKRQQFGRKKNLEVVRDGSADAVTRLKNFGRASENYFLGATCGHGMRPIRIAAAFVFAPLAFVPFYAFGGSFFETSAGQPDSLSHALSPEGLETLFEVARFSYVSYTTIGYGFLGPEGPGAEVLAAAEAYAGVIISALLVYSLVKRSEL